MVSGNQALSEGQFKLWLRISQTVSATAIGSITLNFKNKILILQNCIYVPDIQKNLISVAYLHLQGYTVKFNSVVFIKHNKMNVCSSPLVDGLYYLNPKSYLLQDCDHGNVNVMHAPKRRKNSSVNKVHI